MTQRRAVLSVRKQSDSKKKTLALADFIDQVADLPALSAICESLQEHQQVTVEGVWPGALSPLVATLARSPNSSEPNGGEPDTNATVSKQAGDKDTGTKATSKATSNGGNAIAAGPLLVVTSQLAEAETLAGEVAELLGQECLVFPPGTEETELESLAQQETAQRLRVLSELYGYDRSRYRPVIATTLPAMMLAVPKPQTLEGDKQVLKVGGRIRLKETKSWLEKSGYHATSAVQLPGEYAHRGGILDVYPPDESLPVRIELFDDEIESLRTFDIASQRSIERRQELQLLAADGSVTQDGTLVDYLPENSVVVTHELRAILAAAEAFLARVPFPERFDAPAACLKTLGDFNRVFTAQLADEGYAGQLVQFPLRSVERIGGDLERLAADIDAECGKRPVVLSAINEGEKDRLTELLATSQAAKSGRVSIVVSQLQTGFEMPKQMFVLTAGQLLRRTHVRRITRRTKSKPIDTFSDLRQGDLVVHLSHGIGVYRGTELLEKNGQRFEHLVLEFDGGTKIFVPSSKIELVQRYVGGTKSRPKLAKIGGAAWARQRKAAERAVQDMAVELLELQARRNSQPGIAFADDSVWQNQFDASFSYVETPDQLSAIDAVKGDMLRSRPMDRLICGDVGFGKTEVAMRAAFKAIDSGYQVAVLVPTTVLAEQHFKTFRERMVEFPFDIEKLSRFATNKEQKETLKGIASGRVDIVVGTHRIASKDMKF
ncbi:MAG TPA: transcription-repair coupling factor, partial [Planctomycetaceae bacterium]|nr:transcription-repair coupling factor [Planctomycetaceae bacterium]